MRRMFDWNTSTPLGVISPAGNVRAKIVYVNPEPFALKYDLIQLFTPQNPIQASVDEGGEMLLVQGGDMNYDTFVDSNDAVVFVNEWFVGAPSADLDQNGVINEDDLTRFLELVDE